MKKIFILGATSFLGTYVVETLIKRDYNVTALVRKGQDSTQKLKDKFGNLISYIEGDINNIDFSKLNSLGRFDALYVFAWAGMSKDKLDDSLFQKKWRQSLFAFVEKMIYQCSVEKVILAGSQAEYGIYSGCVDETFAAKPVSAYGKEKLSLYNQVSAVAKLHNRKCIELRIHSIYGVGDKENKFIYYIIRNCIYRKHIILQSDCQQRWNFLNVNDCAKAFIYALEKEVPDGIYNIGGNDQYTLREYVEFIETLLKCQGNIEYGQEMDKSAPDFFYDSSKFQMLTGWSPTISYIDGVSEIIENIKDENRYECK